MVSSSEMRFEVTKHQGASVTKRENSKPDRQKPSDTLKPMLSHKDVHPSPSGTSEVSKSLQPVFTSANNPLAWKAKHNTKQNKKKWTYFLKQFISDPWKKIWSAGTSACLSRLFYLNASLSINQVLISNQTEDSVNCACLEQYWVITSLYTLLST